METQNNVNKIEISKTTRLLSMFLDHAVMSCLLVPIWIIGKKMIDTYMISYLVLAIYLNKDFFNGRSIAKRLLGFRVNRNDSNEVANEFQCFLRNIVFFIWIVEVIALLIKPQKRIGDLIAQTNVVISNKASLYSFWNDIEGYRFSSSTLYTLLATILYLICIHFSFVA